MKIIEVMHEGTTVSLALIKDQNGLMLFDTGYPNSLEQIDTALRASGFTSQDISLVALTHHDIDHVGSLNDLVDQNTDLRVIALDVEQANIEQTKRRDRLEVIDKNYQLGEKVLDSVKDSLELIKPTKVDIVVHDSEKLKIGQGVTVIHTPGHLPGHTSYLLEENNCVIAGDALSYSNGKFSIGIPAFTADRHQAFASIEKILSYNPSSILCYHGGLVEEDLMYKLNELLNER